MNRTLEARNIVAKPSLLIEFEHANKHGWHPLTVGCSIGLNRF